MSIKGTPLPLQITGCNIWLDAFDGHTIEISGGTSISEVINKGIYPTTVYQSSGANQPTYDFTGGPNSKPAIAFNGTDQWFDISNSHVFDVPCTFFVVASFNNFTSDPSIINRGDLSSNGDIRLAAYDTPNTITVDVRDGIGFPVSKVTGLSTSTFYIMKGEVLGNLSSTSCEVDATIGVPSALLSGFADNSVAMAIGKDKINNNQYLNGSIAQIITYNCALTPTQSDDMFEFLNRYCGIELDAV